MGADTVLAYLVLVIMIGSAFFLYLGMYAERNIFLLLGNMCCVAAHVVFIMMILEQNGNENWLIGFCGGVLANTYGFLCVVNKYRKYGCGSDDDSDSDSDAEYDSADERREQKRMLMDKASRQKEKRARRRRAARQKSD